MKKKSRVESIDFINQTSIGNTSANNFSQKYRQYLDNTETVSPIKNQHNTLMTTILVIHVNIYIFILHVYKM